MSQVQTSHREHHNEKKQLPEKLDEIRRRGYSTDLEQEVLSWAKVGALIPGWGGRFEGVKCIYNGIETLPPELLDTGKVISRSRGYFPESLAMRVQGEMGTKPLHYGTGFRADLFPEHSGGRK